MLRRPKAATIMPVEPVIDGPAGAAEQGAGQQDAKGRGQCGRDRGQAPRNHAAGIGPMGATQVMAFSNAGTADGPGQSRCCEIVCVISIRRCYARPDSSVNLN